MLPLFYVMSVDGGNQGVGGCLFLRYIVSIFRFRYLSHTYFKVNVTSSAPEPVPVAVLPHGSTRAALPVHMPPQCPP